MFLNLGAGLDQGCLRCCVKRQRHPSDSGAFQTGLHVHCQVPLCVQDGMKGWAPEQVRTVRNQGLKMWRGYKEERKVRRMKEVELMEFNFQIHREESRWLMGWMTGVATIGRRDMEQEPAWGRTCLRKNVMDFILGHNEVFFLNLFYQLAIPQEVNRRQRLARAQRRANHWGSVLALRCCNYGGRGDTPEIRLQATGKRALSAGQRPGHIPQLRNRSVKPARW